MGQLLGFVVVAWEERDLKTLRERGWGRTVAVGKSRILVVVEALGVGEVGVAVWELLVGVGVEGLVGSTGCCRWGSLRLGARFCSRRLGWVAGL